MATISTGKTLFQPEMVSDMFNKVKGHSALAALSGAAPMPFAGTEQFVFTMDGEASIVAEGGQKPAGEAAFSTIKIVPIKFVYQHRLTEEFVNMAEQRQLQYLQAFSDGFSKKIARALDIAAIHGLNPASGTASDTVGNNCFDKAVTATVELSENTPDDDIDTAATLIQAADGTVNGIAMSTDFAGALGKMKTGDSRLPVYPEFRFGSTPSSFNGMACNVNNTLAFGGSADKAIVGDFQNAFRWGYAENVSLEVIQFGDPDGLGDLKRQNQIVLRSEAYIGWGILDPNSFAIVKAV